jgi:hypothetical protein
VFVEKQQKIVRALKKKKKTKMLTSDLPDRAGLMRVSLDQHSQQVHRLRTALATNHTDQSANLTAATRKQTKHKKKKNKSITCAIF